jgi:hypothetical protein
VETIDAALCELADHVRAGNEKRYLTSDLTHLGVPGRAIRRVAVASSRGLGREETARSPPRSGTGSTSAGWPPSRC